MGKGRKTTTKEIAVCGMLGALSVVIMLAGSIIQVGTFAAPILAALAIAVIREEYGVKSALLCYVSAALVSLFVMPDKELALFYAVFAWYPVALPGLRKIRPAALKIAIQIAIYLAMILSLYGVIMRLLGLDTGIVASQIVLNMFMLITGGISFLLLDRIYENASVLLLRRIKKIIK